jgi:hypothetical protein
MMHKEEPVVVLSRPPYLCPAGGKRTPVCPETADLMGSSKNARLRMKAQAGAWRLFLCKTISSVSG